MPRFAANLTMLFGEMPFLDRFPAARAAGFRGVEYLFPYDFEKAELREQLQQHGLVQVLHNLPAGNWAAGERGIAIPPDRVKEFRDGVHRAIDYAKALECKQLNCLAGIAPADADVFELNEVLVGNLRYAADALSKEGIRLLIEPINTSDIPGFFLSRTGQAAQIVADVGSPNLFIHRSPSRSSPEKSKRSAPIIWMRRSPAGRSAPRRLASPSWSGGRSAAFDTMKPVFGRMGKNVTHVGGNGDGQTTKVAGNRNNMPFRRLRLIFQPLEDMMTNRVTVSLIAASLLLSGPAFGQSTTVQGAHEGARAGGEVGGPVGAIVGGTVGAAVGAAVEIPNAVITSIPRNESSVVVHERVVVGEPLPPSVELRVVPNHAEYRYAVVNDRRVIVEPRTRKVIRVID